VESGENQDAEFVSFNLNIWKDGPGSCINKTGYQQCIANHNNGFEGMNKTKLEC